MPQQLDNTPSSQKESLNENSSEKLRKKSDKRRDVNGDDKDLRRRRKGENDHRKRPARQIRRRSTGNQPSEVTHEQSSPIPQSSREKSTERRRRRSRSRPRSTSRTGVELVSPRSSVKVGRDSTVARPLAPSSKDSPKIPRRRCTKAAAASVVASPVIKMRERRSSLPAASSIRSPFKRSRERRPSLSNDAWMNSAPKIDPEVAHLRTIQEKDNDRKILSPRRVHRRRTIASGRVEADSSSDEQPIVISKTKLNSNKVNKNAKEGSSESKRKANRRVSAIESSEKGKPSTGSSDRKQRSNSMKPHSGTPVATSPRQSKQSGRRTRCSSMQHVSSETLKSLSGQAFREAFVSVQKGACPTESVDSTSKGSRTDTHSSSSASRTRSPRKSKTLLIEKSSKTLKNDFNDDEASLEISKMDRTDPDVDSAEGFFAVRSFIHEQ